MSRLTLVAAFVASASAFAPAAVRPLSLAARPALAAQPVMYTVPEPDDSTRRKPPPIPGSKGPLRRAPVAVAPPLASAPRELAGRRSCSRRSPPAPLDSRLTAVWWGDKEYPPSKVLGIGKDVPSLVYGITSGIALLIGVWCIADSNLLNILSGSNINGWRTAGALILPIYSWGLHVASWIQKQNGM